MLCTRARSTDRGISRPGGGLQGVYINIQVLQIRKDERRFGGSFTVRKIQEPGF